MSCTICGYGFPIADGDAVTLDFEKAKEFLKKHVGSFGEPSPPNPLSRI